MKSKNSRQARDTVGAGRPAKRTLRSSVRQLPSGALRGVVLFFCVGALWGAAAAADVYRWVDERGVPNVSDVVPEKYKKIAQRIDTSSSELDEPTRRAAAARAAAIASAAASGAGRVAAANARQGGSVATPLSASRSASAPASAAGDGDDCATLQRRYKESQDCFGPQPRTITGAINGARSPQCLVVVDPSPKCGLPDGGEAPPATAP